MRLVDAVTISNVLDVELDALVARARSPLDQWFALQRGLERAFSGVDAPLSDIVRHLVGVMDFARANQDLPAVEGYVSPGDIEDALAFELTHNVRGFDLPRSIDDEETALVAELVAAYVVAQLDRSNEMLAGQDVEAALAVRSAEIALRFPGRTSDGVDQATS